MAVFVMEFSTEVASSVVSWLELVEEEGSRIDNSGVSARTSVLLLRSARCTSSVSCD